MSSVEAEYDYVTDLPCFTPIFDTLEEALEDRDAAAIIYVRLAGASALEARHGGQFFDGLVSQLAAFLKEFGGGLPGRSVLGRYGAEDFVLVATGNHAAEDIASDIEARLRARLGETFAGGISDELGLAVGHWQLSLSEGGPTDRALHRGIAQAAEAARGDVDRELQRQRQSAMREVIERKRLHLVHQPIIDAKSGETFGYEMLARAEVEGLRDPKHLWRTAEQCDMVWPLSRLLRSLLVSPLERMRSNELLFVNMHPADFSDPNFIRKEIWEPPLSVYARRMVFEITDRQEIHDLELFKDHLIPLRKGGFRIAIDGVGAGYGDLASLMLLKPDFVKLDRTFIQNVEDDDDRQRAVAVLADVARAANFKVIAVGVETEAEAEALKKFGCHYLQGYHTGRPGPHLG